MATEENTDEPEQAPTAPEDVPAYGEDPTQDYVDRSKLDRFRPRGRPLHRHRGHRLPHDDRGPQDDA